MADWHHDIEKYLKGELTSTEMHALERKALSDPFLADALEGAQHAGAENFSADISMLQHALENRVDKKSKTIPLWNWTMRIAAGLMLLAASTFILYSLLDDKKGEELAMSKQSAPPSPVVEEPKQAATTDSVIAEEPEKSQPEPSEQVFKLERPAGAGEKESRIPLSVQPIQQAPPATADDAQEDKLAWKSFDQDVDTKSQPLEQKPAMDSTLRGYAAFEKPDAQKAPSGVIATAPALREEAKRKRSSAAGAEASEPPNTQAIRGQVTSAEDDTPLPGVNVLISGTNIGTVTDSEGNYVIPIEDMNQRLVFSFIGMESKEVDGGASGVLNVKLDPDMSQLSEVVVVGYGAEKKEGEEVHMYEFASPEGGRTAFKQYLEKSLRYPEQALENNVEGKVTVQFTVDPTGRLTDFRVIKGIGFGCDEEVIRLIKNGPKWAPTKRDAEPAKDRVKVRMRFKLPKK